MEVQCTHIESVIIEHTLASHWHRIGPAMESMSALQKLLEDWSIKGPTERDGSA